MYWTEGTTCHMTRGDDAIFTVSFTKSDGTVWRPGTGQYLKFQVRPSASSETVLIDRPEVCDGRFYLALEDTAAWQYGSYAYEVFLVDTDESEESVFGPYVLKVEQEVTY